MASLSISVIRPETLSSHPSLPRRSTSMHKNLIHKLRPLPFQYVWTMWHNRATTSSNNERALTVLAENVSDIGAFYRIYNNFPWSNVRIKDAVHFFRAGVKPLWEDEQNRDGGCLILKVKRDNDKAMKTWEEICLICCGGELQALLASERDHILGMSFSPRLYWAHISIWTKKGDNRRSVDLLQKAVIEHLSAELRPQSEAEYYYKKHSDHEGWAGIVER